MGHLPARRCGSEYTISSIPIQRPRNTFIGLFVHDDFKLTQRLTLNLGLRYEYYSPMTDPEDRLSRYLDLTNPIPELAGRECAGFAAASDSAPNRGAHLQRCLGLHRRRQSRSLGRAEGLVPATRGSRLARERPNGASLGLCPLHRTVDPERRAEHSGQRSVLRLRCHHERGRAACWVFRRDASRIHSLAVSLR